jgi:hypothetical protein
MFGARKIRNSSAEKKAGMKERKLAWKGLVIMTDRGKVNRYNKPSYEN